MTRSFDATPRDARRHRRGLVAETDLVERFERRQTRLRTLFGVIGATLAGLSLFFSAAVLGPRDGVLFLGLARAGLAPDWSRALEDAESARLLAAKALARGDLDSVARAAELYAQAMRVHPRDAGLAAGRMLALTAEAKLLGGRAARDRAAALQARHPRAATALTARAHTYDLAIEAILREADRLVPLLERPRRTPIEEHLVPIERAMSAHRALKRALDPASRSAG